MHLLQPDRISGKKVFRYEKRKASEASQGKRVFFAERGWEAFMVVESSEKLTISRSQAC